MGKRDRTGIRQLGPNKFEVRVKRIEARTGLMVNRKQVVHGSWDDAASVREELRAELKSTVEKRPRTRLSQYAVSWLKRRADSGELRPSVVRKYGYGLRHILPVLGDLYLDAITRADVQGYVEGRKAEVGLKGGASVLNELRLIRTIARDTKAEGYAPTYWADRVKPPPVRKYTRERPNRLTATQANVVLSRVPASWRGLVMLMITTGLRWGEASALHWEDIKFKKKLVVNKAGQKVQILYGEALIRYGNDRGRLERVKTTSSYRVVPILPQVLVHLGLARERGLVFPVRRGPRKGQLNRGYPLVNVMKRVCASVGVPYTTPHGLRRTFNNIARKKTEDVVLKAITGHSTDEMTEHYSHVEMDEKHDVAQAVADEIGQEVTDDGVD